jgi:hypothetical protein
VLGSVLLVAANSAVAAGAVPGDEGYAFLERGIVTMVTKTTKTTALLRLDLIHGTAELLATTPLQMKWSVAPAPKQVAERLAEMPIRFLGTSGQTEAVCTTEANNLIRAIQSLSESCENPNSQVCVTAQLNFRDALNDFTDCMIRVFTQER